MNTMQQEFDAVVNHLFKQGRQSADDGECLYRGNDGLMCAVGCRIPDSAYTTAMEGESVITMLRMPELFPGLPPELKAYEGMFQALQHVHDDYSLTSRDGFYDKRALEVALRELAPRFGLTFTMPQQ